MLRQLPFGFSAADSVKEKTLILSAQRLVFLAYVYMCCDANSKNILLESTAVFV